MQRDGVPDPGAALAGNREAVAVSADRLGGTRARTAGRAQEAGTRERAGGRGDAVEVSPSRWILVAPRIALVAVGVNDIVADVRLRVRVVHVAAGAAAVPAALSPRRVEPGIVAPAAVFTARYTVEAASPDLVGDGTDPSSNGSLILTGLVLLALVVAFTSPAAVRDQRTAGAPERRRRSGGGARWSWS